MTTKGHDPFAARITTKKAAGKGRMTPRGAIKRAGGGGGGTAIAGRGRDGGTLSWFGSGLVQVPANLPPGIEQSDAVLVVVQPNPPYPSSQLLPEADFEGFQLANAWATQPDSDFAAYAGVGLGVLLAGGDNLLISGRRVNPSTARIGYHAVVDFPTAYTLNPAVGVNSNALVGFAGSGFWFGDWLGTVQPSWDWDSPAGPPGSYGFAWPYDTAWTPAAGYTRVVVAFCDTGPDNYLPGPTYQGWAVEYADDHIVVLSRRWADQMSVTLPADGGLSCSRFVTSLWLPPQAGGSAGGGWQRRQGKLRGRQSAKRVGFEHDRHGTRRRNPFA